MAQHFRSKNLTISIPEKGGSAEGDQTNPTTTTICTCTNVSEHCTCTNITNPCLGFTHCGFSPVTVTCVQYTLCHGFSPATCMNTACNFSPCTQTYYHPTCTPTPCTLTNDPVHNISDVSDPETLSALKEKLNEALKEVEARTAAAKK